MLNRYSTPLDSCNIKFQQAGAVSADDNGMFSGYASVFGGIDSFGDTIMKGAFTDTIADAARMPLMLYGHQSSNVIGKWLRLEEDDTGLYVEGEFTPNHSMADDVRASMLHGAIDGMSIGFRIPESGSEELEDGGKRITKIDLVEVSVVGFPADSSARVAQVRMSDEIKNIESIREAERFLRDADLPISMAKAFISQVRPLFQREADLVREKAEAKREALEWLHKVTGIRK